MNNPQRFDKLIRELIEKGKHLKGQKSKSASYVDPNERINLAYSITEHILLKANRYFNRYSSRTSVIDSSDLFVAGMISALKSAKKYDPAKDVSFLGFAKKGIEHAIQREINKSLGLSGIPSYIMPIWFKVSEVRDDFVSRHGREPTKSEISHILNKNGEYIDSGEINAALNCVNIKMARSLDEIAEGADGEEGIGYGNSRVYHDTSAQDPSEEGHRKDSLEFIRGLVKEEGVLNDRERSVINLRFGLNGEGGPYTLDELGKVFKVTKEMIRQVESRALGKLKIHAKRKERTKERMSL